MRQSKDKEEITKLPSFMASKTLLPYITQEIQGFTKIIEYLDVNNKPNVFINFLF